MALTPESVAAGAAVLRTYRSGEVRIGAAQGGYATFYVPVGGNECTQLTSAYASVSDCAEDWPTALFTLALKAAGLAPE